MDEPIAKMYENVTYFDQYGTSLLLFILITLVVCILVIYFHTMANIQPIVDDWPNQRCKPTILPFAGWITHPEGVSAAEYTAQNFHYCTQTILSNITGFAVQPLTYLTNVLQQTANATQDSIQSIRAMFDKIRTFMQQVTQEIMGRLMNVTVPLMQIIISFRDLIGKIQGSMTAGLFTALGSYYTLKSLMGAIAQFIVIILITLSVMIAAFWAFPFTWGAAIANTSIFVAISVPMAIILTFMKDVLHVNGGYQIPKLKCFDEDTVFTLEDGTTKCIRDIRCGDVLSSCNEVSNEVTNKVTSVFCVLTEGSVMYNLHGILVSDSHIMKWRDQWIPVREHPDAVKVEKYDKPCLYCLNTTTKRIVFNNQVFTDWDEVLYEYDDNTLNRTFTAASLDGNTRVKLMDGTCKKISDIQVRDILKCGGMVYGTVVFDDDLGKTRHHLLTTDGTISLETGCVPDYNRENENLLF